MIIAQKAKNRNAIHKHFVKKERELFYSFKRDNTTACRAYKQEKKNLREAY